MESQWRSQRPEIFVVHAAEANRVINLIQLAQAKDEQTYVAYYTSLESTLCEVNLQACGTDRIAYIVTEFLYDSLDGTRRAAEHYDNAYVALIRVLLDKCPELFENETLFFDAFTGNLKELREKYIKASLPLPTFKNFCMANRYGRNFFKADLWLTGWFALGKERLNITKPIYYITFRVENDKNKLFVKSYILYLLRNTDNSISTICNTLKILNRYLGTVSKPFDEFDGEDTDEIVINIRNHSKGAKQIADKIQILTALEKYLYADGMIDKTLFQRYTKETKYKYQYKKSAPDQIVVKKIFNALGNLPLQCQIYFLLLYHVGMRSSAAISITKDCVKKIHGIPYISESEIKMKEGEMNEISPEFYELMLKYINTLPNSSPYLFPSPQADHQKPMTRQPLEERIRKAISDYEIKNPDGSDYHFTAHSYRHLMAVRMKDHDIAVQFIQEQLHHKSVEMTMAYLECTTDYISKKLDKFVDCNGIHSPLELDKSEMPSTSDQEQIAMYLRAQINAQMLPNGICARPVKLGPCAHCNACINGCENFRTSVDFLDVLKEHLAHVDMMIKACEQAGYTQLVLTNTNTKQHLEKIIASLKEDQYACNS